MTKECPKCETGKKCVYHYRELNRLSALADSTSKKMWVYCDGCRIIQEAYFEVWGCEKNPRGLLCTPERDAKHGNEVDGMITCDDDYCRPFYEERALPSSKKKAIEFMRNHEGVVRCRECYTMNDESPVIWKIFPVQSKYQEKVSQE